ncbi:MotA/TolQ/ExbB proton channel family protein [Desulfococcus sp.]|uniref:MotA/TolQ/ExbB proton channel family protein n=1 Tax=Desulfococcus sp. TaxID=2025834 RepID=UPI003594493D
MLDLFLKGGPLMWPILICSVVALGVALQKWLMLRRALQQLSVRIDDVVEQRPPLLSPIMYAIDTGCSDEEITLIGSGQLRSLQRGLGMLSLISLISPLLGLTGTVTGMIEAFQTIALQQGRVEVSMLAGGIWQALLTTAAGLLVAIPSHVAFHVLDGQMDDIAASMKEVAIVLKKKKEKHEF